ncbi:MAG: cell division protein ZapA [Candidatus Kapaibacterium sp.]
MVETITVQIHGSEYKLRGDDAARIQEAAGMINEQMRYVSSKSPTQPIATIAVLAALNTAELLMTEQDRAGRESGEIVRRLDSLTSTVEELLQLEL